MSRDLTIEFTLRVERLEFGYTIRSCVGCSYEWFGDTSPPLEPYDRCPYCGSGYTERFKLYGELKMMPVNPFGE